MIAILSAVIGLAGSIIPQILRFWQDKKDKEHEIRLLELQIQAQKEGYKQRLEEIGTWVDVEESKALYQYTKPKLTGIKWIDAFNQFLISSVRPVITYGFFLLYASVKVALYQKTQDITAIWNTEDMALFSIIIGFWFGQRSLSKIFKK